MQQQVEATQDDPVLDLQPTRDPELVVPQAIPPEVTVDTAKLKEMTEVVERRASAVVVIPEKGILLMTSSTEGNYTLSIDGIDGSHTEYTINSEGEVLKVGDTDVRDIGPFHESKINMLNEYLDALPQDQIKLNPISAGQIPDYRPESSDALAQELQNGHVDKTRVLTSLWAASGGRPSQLRTIIEESQDLRPDALTPELFARVGEDLRSEAASVTVDPEEQIKQNRQSMEMAYQLSNPELSGRLTTMYQELSGDTSANVVVSSSVLVRNSVAVQIGDGNVIFSEDFYNSIVTNYPDPADQEKIILDILKHEREHYLNADIPSGQISIEAQDRYMQKVEEGFLEERITEDEAVALVYAAELLIKAEMREQERGADGLDGLQPDTVDAIQTYKEAIEAANTSGNPDQEDRVVHRDFGGGLFLTHPQIQERTER